MDNIYEYYTLTLTTLSPLFIGSGASTGKKEYCVDTKNHLIHFIDMQKLMAHVCSLNNERRLESFEAFLLDADKRDLYTFLQALGISPNVLKSLTLYSIPTGQINFNDRQNPVEVQRFMRDGNGHAYLPGSSVKGMIRTVLLSYLLSLRPDITAEKIDQAIDAAHQRIDYQLKDAAQETEERLMHTNRLTSKTANALNSIMKGLMVSDSLPLNNADFILARKKDVPPIGHPKYNMINISRECLRPGIEVSVHIKIDNRYFRPQGVRYTNFADLFAAAVRHYDAQYNSFYMTHFDIPNGNVSSFSEPFVLMGGGAGYFGKNIIYSLNGFKKGLPKVSRYMAYRFPRTNPDDLHCYGISPHMLKVTPYGQCDYQFGLCRPTLTREDSPDD